MQKGLSLIVGLVEKFSLHIGRPINTRGTKARIVEITQNSSLLLTDKQRRKDIISPIELKIQDP